MNLANKHGSISMELEMLKNQVESISQASSAERTYDYYSVTAPAESKGTYWVNILLTYLWESKLRFDLDYWEKER